MDSNILHNMKDDVSYVVTTSDGWSMRGRAVIGLTVHWIDPNTINPRWAALLCEQMLPTLIKCFVHLEV